MVRATRRRRWKILFFVSVLFLIAVPGWAATERCACPNEIELTLGAEGEDVTELQRFLKNENLYFHEISGVFDAATREAVNSFQRKNGLPATGKVDFATWNLLGQSATTPVLTNPPPGDLRIIVDLKYLTLTVLVDNQPFASFPVAIGKRETPSPVGDWKLISKGQWSGGFGTRWLGLNVPFGIYGIHGTNKPWSIGRLESQGCVRMFNRDVEQLYRWVKIGTPVHIIGDPFMGRRRLVKGEKGSDVMFLQKRLKQLGLYEQKADGIYGYATEQAVKKFQAERRLPVTGQVGWAEYQAMGLLPEE
ncbi:MAG: L,D-transpeptidase family protein [Firmicutes bacterium]|nr:L,D-transpeptidase family protein [Bacillota bacterium]